MIRIAIWLLATSLCVLSGSLAAGADMPAAGTDVPAAGAVNAAAVALDPATGADKPAAMAADRSPAGAAAGEPPLEPRHLGAGIHLFEGLADPPGPANRARTGNVVVIIGSRGVLVWNSGASDRHGEALVAAISRLTDLPPRAVVLSEPGQDLVFGATAFARRGARILMSVPAAATMRLRCEACLGELRRLLGDAEMDGTRLPDPEPLDRGTMTWIMDAIGRDLRWFDLGEAANGGTISLFDPASGVLLAGPMVMVRRVGDVRDADLDGWRRGLDTLARLAPRLVIPDRGEAGGPTDLKATRDYLDALEARTAALLADGVSLAEAGDRAGLPVFATWAHGEDIHRANVHFRYLALEREQLQSP